MRELLRIEAAYDKLDLLLEEEKLSITVVKTAHIEFMQILNDQAYFLLCWGQLEFEINDVCKAAIRRRRSSPDWQVRRPWYLYNPDDKRLSGLSFDDRAALVMDREGGRGSTWARTMHHYATRNEIAHGTLRSTRIDVNAFVQDCYVIQAALHGSA